MPLVITAQPAGTRFAITADALMPTITVTAALQGGAPPAGTTPIYEWTATLTFDGGTPPTNTSFGANRTTQHTRIAPQTSASASWRIPFTEVRGGLLTVQVTVRMGNQTQSARATWTIVGTNPTGTAIRAYANSIGANRTVFRKKMRQESSLQQFRTPGNWPKYSSDGLGGVGLCQITRPAPTADETWDWKANVRRGWAMFQEKERIARAYPKNVRKGETTLANGQTFPAMVAAWNQARAAQGLPAATVTLPDYTDEQLELDTLRGFNGYANRLHEYRVRLNNGALFVTMEASGTQGHAEWERVPVEERGTRGDPNYVENVLAQEDF